MQSDVRPSNWSLGEVSPLIQQIAKNGAAMCIAALCTAFVFDYTFWLIVDPRMLSYFVLADHIQTAVHIFGLVSVILGASWILTLVFVYAGFAVTRSDQCRSRPLSVVNPTPSESSLRSSAAGGSVLSRQGGRQCARRAR